MEISENGSAFLKADAVLYAAIEKYWKAKNSEDNFWHFIHKTKDIRTHTGNKKSFLCCFQVAFHGYIKYK